MTKIITVTLKILLFSLNIFPIIGKKKQKITVSIFNLFHDEKVLSLEIF